MERVAFLHQISLDSLPSAIARLEKLREEVRQARQQAPGRVASISRQAMRLATRIDEARARYATELMNRRQAGRRARRRETAEETRSSAPRTQGRRARRRRRRQSVAARYNAALRS